jgi:hypothetical protein
MVNGCDPVPEVGVTVSHLADGNTETVHAWLLSERVSARLGVPDCKVADSGVTVTSGFETDSVPGFEAAPANDVVTVALTGSPL